MLKRSIQAVLVAVVVLGVTLWWGCSQPDDILLEKSETVLYLQAERLPSNPSGMIYELWVVDQKVDDSLIGGHSIEQFGYDFETGTYYDATGAVREESNRFVLEDDIYNYGFLAVTVQRTDGTGPEFGPVLLMDTIRNVWENPLTLLFPKSDTDTTGSAVAYYQMLVSSVDGAVPQAYQGSAVWFNSFFFDTEAIEDTLSIIDFDIDTVWVDTLGEDLLRTSVTNILNPQTITVKRGFGLDTLDQQAVTFETEVHVADASSPDSINPDNDSTFWLTTRLEITFETANYREISFFDHVQIAQPMLDLSSYGWLYEGWVLASTVGDAAIGSFTRPAWQGYTNPYDSMIHGMDGGMISTGQFTNILEPDLSNPYSSSEHITPPYPGEDFVQNLPNGATAPLSLVPNNNGPHGSVLITCEPTNRVSDTTNFPLIAMVAPLPDSVLTAQADSQSFAMKNRMAVNRSVLVGFPRVEVEIERY